MDEVFGNVDFVRVEIILAQNLLCDFVWGKYRWWFVFYDDRKHILIKILVKSISLFIFFLFYSF